MFPVSHRLDLQSSYSQHPPIHAPVGETDGAGLSTADSLLPDDISGLRTHLPQESRRQEAPPGALAHLVPPENQVKESLEQLLGCSPTAALEGTRHLANKMWEQRDFRIDTVLADGFNKVADRLPADFVVEDAASSQRLAPSDVRSLKLYALWAAWHLRERAQANLRLQLKREKDAHGRADFASYRLLVREVVQATCEARLHIALWTGDIVAVQRGHAPLAEPHTKLALTLSGIAYNLKVEATGGSPAAVWQQWEEDVLTQLSDNRSQIKSRRSEPGKGFA